MKILFISMPSLHAIRWIENMIDTNYELYWFDILDRGRIEVSERVKQYTGWKKRKRKRFKGEYFLSKKLPIVYQSIQSYLEVTQSEVLENIIQEINPDIVHSFQMQDCIYPMIETMTKFPELKWIYSSWGSDLFYYKKDKWHRNRIIKALSRINFMHSDNQRDYKIAKELHYKGDYLDVIPGGGGYHLERMQKNYLPIKERKIILVKGYEHIFGRGLNCVKALDKIKEVISKYEVIVFGAHKKVIEYIRLNKLPFKVYDRHGLSQEELLKIMGKSFLYIGNSISDGIPNTLLESIIMGAFPIQSNPGKVTEEIINNNINGLLIEDPLSVSEIKSRLNKAINNFSLAETGAKYNSKIIKDLEYKTVRSKILNLYLKVYNS